VATSEITLTDRTKVTLGAAAALLVVVLPGVAWSVNLAGRVAAFEQMAEKTARDAATLQTQVAQLQTSAALQDDRQRTMVVTLDRLVNSVEDLKDAVRGSTILPRGTKR
jgi:hypothetical protein